MQHGDAHVRPTGLAQVCVYRPLALEPSDLVETPHGALWSCHLGHAALTIEYLLI